MKTGKASSFPEIDYASPLRLLSDISENASIDIEHMTVYEVACFGTEEDGRTHQILGSSPALGGRLGDDEGIEGVARSIRLLLPQRRGLRRGDVSGPYSVALDIVFAIFTGDVAGQHLQPAFRGGIGGDGLSSQLAHHRTDIDDLSASSLHHRRKHRFSDDEGGGQIDVDDQPPIIDAHLMHRNALDDAGVVHEDIDRSKILFDLLRGLLDCRFIRHIADISFYIEARFLIGGKPLIHQLPVDVVESDFRSRLGICQRDIQTDAVAAAGNPGDFPLDGEF